MTDFNQLHKLANELEEFSSKTLNQKIKPRLITRGAILPLNKTTQLTSNNFPQKNNNINKKTWPSSPSLEFFTSPEVVNAQAEGVKKLTPLKLKLSTNDFNAHSLLNSKDKIQTLRVEGDSSIVEADQTILKPSKEVDYVLEDIGFIPIEDIISQQNLNKTKKIQAETHGVKTFLKPVLGIKSQAFFIQNKEVGFSLSSFILDLILNFSLFVLINSAYKVLFVSGSLFQLSSINFFFLFSLVFQLSNFFQRGFFKQSFGEWYTNVQVGTNQQQSSFFFPLSLFWKSFITLFTGVVILPVISFLINKDLSYYLTDLQTFQKNKS